MGILDYLDEYLPSLGGVFGDANSSPPVPPPPASIPGGDTGMLSVPRPIADAAGMGPMQGQTSPALPQWLQTAQDSYRWATPLAGLTQAQFDNRFGAGANGSNPSGLHQPPAPSAVDETSRFDGAKFDPQTYAGNSGSPSWLQQMVYPAPRSEKPGNTANANGATLRKLQTSSSQVSNVGSMTGSEIFRGLLRRGYNEIQAAVLTGNILQESGGNPNKLNAKEGANGFVQWRNDRWQALQDFAKKNGKSANDPNIQLDFIRNEFDGSEKQNAKAFLSAKDLPSANAALKRYIRYGDDSEGKRLAYARGFVGGTSEPTVGAPQQLAPQAPLRRPRNLPDLQSTLQRAGNRMIFLGR